MNTSTNTVEKYQIERRQGHICLRIEGYQHLTLLDSKEILSQIGHYRSLQEEKIKLILDISNALSIDSEARTHLASYQNNTCLEALALVATTPISKLIAGFIGSNAHRDLPIKNFENRNEAELWLLSKV